MRIAVQRTIGNVAGFHFKRNVYSIKRLFFKCSVFLKKKTTSISHSLAFKLSWLQPVIKNTFKTTTQYTHNTHFYQNIKVSKLPQNTEYMTHSIFYSIKRRESWPTNLAALPTNGLHPTTRETRSYFVILWKAGKNWGEALKRLIMLTQKLHLLNTTSSRFFQRRSWRGKRIGKKGQKLKISKSFSEP